jgi:hypothetical protein
MEQIFICFEANEMVSHRSEAVNFTYKTNLDWKGIKANYLFVLLKSEYFKTK